MVNPHVPQVNLKGDDSVDVVIEIADFDTGHWADVSGYVIQDAAAPGTAIQAINIFAPFSAILVVPDAPAVGGDPSVTVNVPGLNLNPAADVKVIVRVTEAHDLAHRVAEQQWQCAFPTSRRHGRHWTIALHPQAGANQRWSDRPGCDRAVVRPKHLGEGPVTPTACNTRFHAQW